MSTRVNRSCVTRKQDKKAEGEYVESHEKIVWSMCLIARLSQKHVYPSKKQGSVCAVVRIR